MSGVDQPYQSVSFLSYRRFLHLKLSSALVLVCLAAYLTHEPIAGHIGSTWLGYTLGGVSAGGSFSYRKTIHSEPGAGTANPVSYTHLTLPTNREV